MEKEPKNPGSPEAEGDAPAPSGAAPACAGASEGTGLLREVKQEVKAQVFHNTGYLRLDWFTLFWLFVAGCVIGLAVETVFHAIVYGGLWYWHRRQQAKKVLHKIADDLKDGEGRS